MPVKASARKSLGEYKPLLVFADGSTKILEQAPERKLQYSRAESRYHIANKMARGMTYTTREEAIVAAEAHIADRIAEARERYEKFEATAPEHLKQNLLASVKREIELWGGTI